MPSCTSLFWPHREVAAATYFLGSGCLSQVERSKSVREQDVPRHCHTLGAQSLLVAMQPLTGTSSHQPHGCASQGALNSSLPPGDWGCWGWWRCGPSPPVARVVIWWPWALVPWGSRYLGFQNRRCARPREEGSPVEV